MGNSIVVNTQVWGLDMCEVKFWHLGSLVCTLGLTAYIYETVHMELFIGPEMDEDEVLNKYYIPLC